MSKKSKQYSVPATQRTASKPPPLPAPLSQTDRGRLIIAGAIAGLAFVLYANTLGHGFVLDDALVTTLNKYVQRGFGGLFDIFTHSYRAGSSVSTDSEYMYRPISVAMFAVEWAIAPNSPGFHHFMNVLLYALTGGLIYGTVRKLLPEQHHLLAAGAAVLFVAHPLHTEVVANIKSRDEILSLFFSLLCLYYYWDFAVGKMQKKLMPALFAFFLALLSKEGAVTMLLILPLALYFLGKNTSPGLVLRQSVWLLLPFVAWVFLRTAIMGGKLAYSPHINDNQLVAAAFSEHWATGFSVLGKYLQLLVWPASLSWDYSYYQLPTVGWSDPRAFGSLALHAGLFGYAVWGTLRRQIPAFCVLAYLISLALYSNLFILIGALLGERLAYTASLWFCLGIVFLLLKALQLPAATSGSDSITSLLVGKNAKIAAGIIGLFVVMMALPTIRRNADWKDNFTLFTTDRHHAPNSFRTQFAAGEQLLLKFNENKFSPDSAAWLNEARQCFERSLAIQPTENAWNGLGNIAHFQKDYVGAAGYYRKTYEMKPDNAANRERVINAYRELARQESQVKHDNAKALEYLGAALSLDPNNVQTLNLLGTANGFLNQHKEAVAYFEKARAIEPNNKDVLRNLSIGYRMLGDVAKADEYAKKAGQ